MLGVGWGAERPGTSIVVVAGGPEPLRSDIRLPLTPIRKIYVKTGTLGVTLKANSLGKEPRTCVYA